MTTCSPEHIIGQAQSGTGKTAAFSLGMLSRVDPAKRYPQAVCVCPTRELAKQISDVIRSLAKYCNISVRTIVAQDKRTFSAAKCSMLCRRVAQISG